MKPTIEEVIEKYKDAKEVKCAFDGGIYTLENGKYEEDSTGFFYDLEQCYVRLYSFKREVYAEIISYKTPKLEIDKDLILKIAEKCPSRKDDLKKEFPSVFDCEIGFNVWVKFENTGNLIYKISNSEYYGFIDGEFIHAQVDGISYEGESLATPSEIISALTKEAEKRGLVKGANVKGLGDFSGVLKLGSCFGNQSGYYYSDSNRLLANLGKYENIVLFDNGTWATPIQTVTQKELLDFYKSEKGITNEIIVEG